MSTIIRERINKARLLMKEHQIDVLIIPTSDPHQSEYLAEHWKIREWLSGFTGSQGTLIIAEDFAGLWVDSRYFLQAENELKDTGIEMMPLQNQGSPEYIDWIADNMEEEALVAIDGSIVSISTIEQMQDEFEDIGIDLTTEVPFIDALWTDRPNRPSAPAFEISTDYTGESRASKLSSIIHELNDNMVEYYLVSALDEIAWTLNIRGADVECNPVCISYLLIGTEKSIWFVDKNKLSNELISALEKDNVFIEDYDHIFDFLSTLESEDGLLLDISSTNYAIGESLCNIDIVESESLVMYKKAIKNDTEIGHIREIMRHDGAAIFRTEMWLRNQLENNKEVREYEVANKLIEERGKVDGYHGESFDAIVGYNSHGAIVHFKPTPENSQIIKNEGMLLVDSGGQYTRGTTDITRTWALSTPTDEQKKCYTAVLKGHIALDLAQFPQGTMGVQLDILARQPLWNLGLNYGHGTGHGVGFFLNVHEPPQGFTPTYSLRGKTVQKPGMLTSNEPGYYKEGAFGIRIENLILTVERDNNFLGFENLTLYPIDKDLIEKSDLSQPEIEWLNDYHTNVYDQLSGLLSDEDKAILSKKCAPL